MKIRVTYPDSFTTKRADGQSRVYDCFAFFNELDLLDIRLNELADVVDYFVICEARLNFRGHEKSLFLAENRERYAAFKDRIIHVVVENFDDPSAYRSRKLPGTNPAWIRETAQRNACICGLEHSDSSDWVLISDLDEVPRPEILRRIATDRMFRRGVFFFEQDFYQNRLNWLVKEDPWMHGTRMIERRFVTSLQEVRMLKTSASPRSILPWLDWRARTIYDLRAIVFPQRIPHAGWHFTSIGAPAEIVTKHWSYSHYDQQSPDEMNIDRITERIDAGLNQWGIQPDVRPLSDLPRYVQLNQGRFSHLIASPCDGTRQIDDGPSTDTVDTDRTLAT
ncbi:MAG: hypothetical protein AAFN27_09665 [Pseudomonadota bacterium]